MAYGAAHEAAVTRHGVFDVQVCVPKDWTDEQVIEFIQRECGNTEWGIRKEGSKRLSGDPERNPCDDRPDFVHIVADFL